MGQGPLPAPFPSPYTPPGTPADKRRQIHYATDGIQPPAAVYVDVNDSLVVGFNTIDTPVVVRITYRLLLPNGEIQLGQQDSISTNSTGLFQLFQYPLVEGFLIGLRAAIVNTGSVQQRGMTRARVWISRGAFTLDQLTRVLVQGMLDEFAQLTWPEPLYEPACSGMGTIRSIRGTTPAAGADISETVQTVKRWRMQNLNATLTTSATVANRNVLVTIDDGTSILLTVEAPSTQVASTTQQYNIGAIGSRLDKVSNGIINIPIPIGFIANAGYRFRTVTTGIQAADQWSTPQYSVEEWFS